MHIITVDSRNFVPVSKSFNSEQVHTEHQLTNGCPSFSCLETTTFRGKSKEYEMFKFSLQFLFHLPLQYIFNQGLETRARTHVATIKNFVRY